MDYRDLEDRSADLQIKADAIKDKAKGRELSATEQDKVDSFEMNATSYALVAAEWKQKEQAELRDIVAHGRPLTGGIGSSQSAIWVIALGAIAVAGIHAVAHARGWIGPRATRWSRDRFATALAVGAAVLAGLGLVVNDSSIAVPATMLIVFVPVLVLRQTTPDEGAAR